MEVSGITILSFKIACVNLNFFGNKDDISQTEQIDPQGWYPYQLFKNLEETIYKNFDNPAPVFEMIGEEMIKFWIENESGKSVIKSGIDYLNFQKDSNGYSNMVRGESDTCGEFKLTELDLNKGKAIIHSTTPFSRDMEKGTIYGGLTTPGDLSLVRVEYSDNNFFISFK
ncbi:MAG: hypothetical protein JXR63_07220 [Spirochaetales bacterium]|nr:hypothetical protein [Spirochaetales bacterium]